MKRLIQFIFLLLMPLALMAESFGPMTFVYKLHGQTRRYTVEFQEVGKTMEYQWGIERNGHWQSGTFIMSAKALKDGNMMSFLQPIDGEKVALPDNETYNMLSSTAFKSLKDSGNCQYNGVEYKVDDIADGLIHISETVDGSEMWILYNERFPIVMKMQGNPLGMNWTVNIAK